MTILSGDHANVDLLFRESLTLTAGSTTHATGASAAVHGAGNNVVIVKGDVGVATVAMDFSGAHNLVTIAATGSVEGVNAALQFASSLDVHIANAGTVVSGDTAVLVSEAAGNTAGCQLFNSGTLIGGSYALHLADGDDQVVNTGLMSGRVALGKGDDSFDSSQGVLGGEGIDGGAGNDTLIGSAYVDHLAGGTDDDELWGNAGNDRLDGGAGADELHGGAGIDLASYAGSSTAVSASLTTPTGNTGQASGDSYDSIEGLVGSARADRLTGNSGNNRLDGGAGADTLSGLGGNDSYRVDNAGDRVVEAVGGGIDTVVAGVDFSLAGSDVENLFLVGSTGHLGRGNGLGNALRGSSGDDTLAGGLGHDTLSGGAGFDTFLFDSAAGSAHTDTLTDFDRVDDLLAFKTSVFSALGGAGTHLPSGEFRLGTKALDSNDHILYDSASGWLRYDADGSGAVAALLVLHLEPGTALTASDVYGVV